MNRINVVLPTEHLDGYSGALEQMRLFLQYLGTRSDFQAHLVLGQRLKNRFLAREFQEHGIRVIQPSWDNPLISIKNSRAGRMLCRFGLWPEVERSVFKRRLRNYLKRLAPPKVMHCWILLQNLTRDAIMVGQSLSIPILFTETQCANELYPYYDEDYKRFLTRVDAATCMGKYAFEGMRSFMGFQGPLYNIPATASKPLIPLSLDHAESQEDAPCRLGCVSRLEPYKGVEFLIAAMRQVRQQLPTAKLYIWGDGQEKPRLEMRVRALGLGNCVHLMGNLESIDEITRQADIFISPSLNETFPTFILECLARQKLIIATDVGSVREIYANGMEDLLVAPGSTEQLAAKILHFSQAVARRRKLELEGWQRYCSHFAPEKVFPQYIQVYRRLLGIKGDKPL